MVGKSRRGEDERVLVGLGVWKVGFGGMEWMG